MAVFVAFFFVFLRDTAAERNTIAGQVFLTERPATACKEPHDEMVPWLRVGREEEATKTPLLLPSLG